MSAPEFTEFVDLAAERLGGAALIASDEFFAPKENLLKPGRGEWREGVYTERGKWMDGWETRRRRGPGHDWCIVRLGIPGVIRGVDVDTNHFKGNYPEACSLEACALDGNPSPEELLDPAIRWEEVLPRAELQGHSQNLFAVGAGRIYTHARLRIYPDGGVARLRVYGDAMPDWRRLARAGGWIDLAAVANGGVVIACNDMFFGSRHNMIMPGRAANMGDGWETRRKRKLPGFDWAIVRLGVEGTIRRIEVDTNHFKGNYPESCAIEGLRAEPGAATAWVADEARAWEEILPRTKLQGHTRHFFEETLRPAGPFTHVRVKIFPDGGISRLRLHGEPSREGFERAMLARIDALATAAAESALLQCCGCRRWAEAVAARRPFGTKEALLRAADEVWAGAGREDALEAFRAHPRIGSRRDVEAKRGAERAWSEGEQAGARGAPEETLAALAEANRAYEERFGHVYIVCATGKSADEMLANLRERLRNDPETELRVAAAEQAKIMRIRLEKLLAP